MTESVATEPLGRALNAADADQALTILSRHALTVRDATAPTTVTVANGPISLRISWEAHPSSQERVAASANGTAPGNGVGPANGASVNGGAPVNGAAADGRPSAAESDSDNETFVIASDTVGVFYRLPEPGAAPFVTEGDIVRSGQQVGIVEAMKLMIPITATTSGRVVEFLVDNGAAVEHGAPLMRLEVTG
ncbi:acetyl-CoA carboxylase biotin carboxyl carrier protein [Nocardia noduli]|uniref:acetyl-CoA carboxylase biotin carboxyl carrier protein n=1 Tax=Nocardia noduli TaxID=2815722 RepID=UPI001C235F3F|nr:acetyl-CoA carboxylase biotin carboxyl carrier protein subunit [Nocardia noduli]